MNRDPRFWPREVCRRADRDAFPVLANGVAADTSDMTNQMLSLITLLIAGLALGMYILRRRSRQGRRTPKF
jgi:hypothetical protein